MNASFIRRLLLAAGLGAVALGASAQGFPSKPVKLIVPAPETLDCSIAARSPLGERSVSRCSPCSTSAASSAYGVSWPRKSARMATTIFTSGSFA